MKNAFVLAWLLGGGLALQQNFVPEEATIKGIHAALSAGQLTCVQAVRAYLNRIEAYDDRGPALNAIITINPKAVETAAEMDRLYAANRSALQPLHCIPVILKDNYDTADMPTTGGSLTLAESIPARDAFVVKKLREAGALILAKANLMELARAARRSVLWAADPGIHTTSHEHPAAPAAVPPLRLRQASESRGPAAIPCNLFARRLPLKAWSACDRHAA